MVLLYASLHVFGMQHFGNRISGQDSEMLMQYLTAPYLRIPLLLEFFADEARIHSLDSEGLQSVLTSAIFEPSTWQQEHSKALPEVRDGQRDCAARRARS